MTACSRQRRCNTATLSVSPNTVRRGLQLRPYDSDRDNFLTMCFQGHGHYTQIFSSISRKKFGKKFPPGGSDPQNFWKSRCIPPRRMCLQNFSPITLKLWPVDFLRKFKKRHFTTVEAKPRSPGGSGAQNFFCLFFPGSGV